MKFNLKRQKDFLENKKKYFIRIMPIPKNPELYQEAKRYADAIYKKHSAFKSGFIQKKYKELGGKFTNDNKTRNLKRWFREKWKSVSKSNQYPVFRPSKRISRKTPLTINEISTKNLKKQIKLKQKIKGKQNLPPFVEKNSV